MFFGTNGKYYRLNGRRAVKKDVVFCYTGRIGNGCIASGLPVWENADNRAIGVYMVFLSRTSESGPLSSAATEVLSKST